MIIPANPGFWWHRMQIDDNESDLIFTTEPIIAWRLTDNGELVWPPVIPLRGTDNPTQNWDQAVEYPNGQCVDDDNQCHQSAGDWAKQSTESFLQTRQPTR